MSVTNYADVDVGHLARQLRHLGFDIDDNNAYVIDVDETTAVRNEDEIVYEWNIRFSATHDSAVNTDKGLITIDND